jgi:cytochrome c-type biogenesis protein CcmH/NrfG
VLELAGELDAAAAEAQEATRQESTNWQTWLVLSRLEARRGNAEEALSAYREARSLNPQSPLFQQ